MRTLIAMFLAIAPMVLAQEREESPMHASDANAAEKGTWRLSVGPAVGSVGLGGLYRGVVGQAGSAWRFGAQGMHLSELRLLGGPSENVGSFHLLAGRELSRSGSGSAMLLAGLGTAQSQLRGRLLDQGLMFESYEMVRHTDMSLLAGMDFGLSFRRNIGLSLQLGLQVSRVTTPYVALQLDAGAW